MKQMRGGGSLDHTWAEEQHSCLSSHGYEAPQDLDSSCSRSRDDRTGSCHSSCCMATRSHTQAELLPVQQSLAQPQLSPVQLSKELQGRFASAPLALARHLALASQSQRRDLAFVALLCPAEPLKTMTFPQGSWESMMRASRTLEPM